MKDFRKVLVHFGIALLFILSFLVFLWFTQQTNFPKEVKIEATGEKAYGCTYDWQKDKVIKNCKWYPVYKENK